MPSSKDQQGRATPSILVVGDGGTQKTRFLAGCPKPFIFDFDAGLASAPGSEFEYEYETFKDAPFFRRTSLSQKLPGVNEKRGIYEWGTGWTKFIEFINEKVWPQVDAGTWPHQTLGFDSITTLANLCTNYILKSVGAEANATLTLPQWGMHLRLLEVVIEQVAAWPVQLVMTAHIKRDDNTISGEREFLPLVAGQLGAKIGIYFDEVYYTKVDGKGDQRKVRAQTEATGLYRMAKSRANVKDGSELNWKTIGPQIKK